MKRSTTTALLLMLALSACSSGHHDQDKMKVSLDKIRGMVKQSVLLATQAVCSEPAMRTELSHASVVLLRRAMGGPEMEAVHKMMGQMTMDQPGKTPEKTAGMSAQEQLHIDIHAAGEDAFDFLDAETQDSSMSCADIRPLSLAASAALLRESPSEEVSGVAKTLDAEAGKQLNEKTPATVRALTLDLQKI